MAGSVPSVSFVCTFYNKEFFVPITLKSIRSQRHLGEVEYIFVDDGSTDNTLSMLQDITRDWDNCKIITRENGGQTEATITGLKLATKDYIKTWDGDDYAHPDLTYHLMKACEDLDVSFAYTPLGYNYHNANDDINDILADVDRMSIPQAVLKKNILKHVLKSHVTNPTGSIFKRTLLNDMGLPDKRVVIPDVYMSYAATLRRDAAAIQEPRAFAFIYQHDDRLTCNEAQIMHDLNAALACFYDNFYDQLSRSEKVYIGRRAYGRARLWASRELKSGLFCREMMYYLHSKFLPWPLSKKAIFNSCQTFRKAPFTVRISPEMQSQQSLKE